MRFFKPFTVLILFSGLASGAALAQATRTWVSGVGDDANPCSRTAPCKTFAGAISKTASGGIISVLDPGGYSAVTITKPITIETDGAIASILASGTQGVIVNIAGGTGDVTLRGLRIDGAGTTLGTNGINFISGGSLTVDHCTIERFSRNGIFFQPNSVSANLVVTDSLIRRCGSDDGTGPTGTYGGIDVAPTLSTAAVTAVVNRTVLQGNLFGMRARDGSKVTANEVVASGNQRAGFLLLWLANNPADMTVESCVATGNGSSGFRADGARATGRMSNLTTTQNAVGVSTVNGGTIQTFGNNRNYGNGTDGGPTSSPIPLQ